MTRRVLRSGYDALVLYCETGPHAGLAYATDAFQADAPQIEPGRVLTGAGTLTTSGRVSRFAPVLLDSAAIQWVQQATADGWAEHVRVFALARRLGRHLRWEQAVPLHLDRVGSGASLAGHRLLLESHRLAPAVTEAASLVPEMGAWATIGNVTSVVATDPATSLPVLAARLTSADALVHASAVLPGAGPVAGTRYVFSARVAGQAELTLAARAFADRDADPLTDAAGTGALAFASAVAQDGSGEVALTLPPGAWILRASARASGGFTATISAPLLLRAPDAAPAPGALARVFSAAYSDAFA